MSTITNAVRLAAARPATPARRALLALAEVLERIAAVLARIAMHRPDPEAAAARAAVLERRERDIDRLLALGLPLR